jgi:hypothetical protein
MLGASWREGEGGRAGLLGGGREGDIAEGRRMLGASWGEGARGRRPDDSQLWEGLESAGRAAGLDELKVP